MTDTPSLRHEAYIAARAAAAWADLSDHGWLRVTGRDRLAFLQRLTTNDLRGLTPGAGLPTVLCSATGRVIAPLLVSAGPDVLWLRTPLGRADFLAAHFNRLIFWNDEVEVTDASATTAQFGLFGPAAARLLAGLTDAALDDLPACGWRSGHLDETSVMILRGGALEPADWTIIVEADRAVAVSARLAAVAPQLTAAQVTTLRVEKGLPAWPNELNDQVTPLEVGLRGAISDNKGCYTGQEVIARQLNYDKVTRQLVGLCLPADAAWADLTAAAIRTGSGRSGFVGTVVWSPALGRPIALAIVPRDVAATGQTVMIAGPGQPVTATVVTLPFTEGCLP